MKEPHGYFILAALSKKRLCLKGQSRFFIEINHSSGASMKSVAAQRLVDSTALSQLSCEI